LSESPSVSDTTMLDPSLVDQLFSMANGEYDSAGWQKVDDVHVSDSRWTRIRWLILRDPQERLWGVRYSVGATENQDSFYPWEDSVWGVRRTSVEAFRVRSERITTTIYKKWKAER
jgi:hypothetical protein